METQSISDKPNIDMNKPLDVTEDGTIEVNDSIDELLDEDLVGGEVKDTIDVSIERNKRAIEFEKREQDRIDNFDKDMKKKLDRESRLKLWFQIKAFFSPVTWSKFIQYFDPLLIVLMFDVSAYLILFSLVYILYIIISFDMNNLWLSVGKIGGCVILFFLSLLVQNNLNSNRGSEND